MNAAGERMPAHMVWRFPMSALPVRARRLPVIPRFRTSQRVFPLLWAMFALQVAWMLGWTPSVVRPAARPPAAWADARGARSTNPGRSHDDLESALLESMDRMTAVAGGRHR